MKMWKTGKSCKASEVSLFPTKRGTPQGGTISPLIMNMVLDGLETIIMKKFPRWKRQKVNFIRYADDFVITAIDKQTITNDIIPLVKAFLAERGLELSPEKSKITHINEGFNFLSQNVRKYKGKLLIHPSKEAIQSFKDKIKKLFRENRGIPAHALIRILNPVIRGWSNYHKGIEHNRLYRIAYVPIQYHVKVKANANPFLAEYDNYFFQRTRRRDDLAKECKQITTFIGFYINILNLYQVYSVFL